MNDAVAQMPLAASALAALPEAALLVDDDGVIVQVNAAAKRLIPAGESWLGCAIDTVIDQPSMPWARLVARADARQRPATQDAWLGDATAMHPIEVRLGRFSVGDARYGIVTLHDVSRRYVAERQLTRSASRLQFLHEAIAAATGDFGPGMSNVLRLAAKELGADCAVLAKGDGADCRIVRTVGTDGWLEVGAQIALEDLPWGALATQEAVVFASDDVEDEQVSGYVGMPVRVHGARWGTVCFAARRSGQATLQRPDHELVYVVAAWIGAALTQWETASRLEGLLDAVPDLLLVINGAGLIIERRDGAPGPMPGLEKAVVGAHVVHAFDVDVANRFSVALAAVRQRLNVGATELTFPAGAASGGRWYDARLVATGDGHALVIVRDVTELRHRQDELERYAAELARSNRDLDDFAYIASHDLKAPLNAIETLVGWISEDAGDVLPDDAKGHLDRLVKRVHRMKKLLTDLLGYSRLGRMATAIEPTDTRALCESVVALVGPPSNFSIHLGEGLPVLTTDKVALELVIRNLVNNAVKHHDKAQGNIWIDAEDVAGVSHLTFSVRDDGPGIDPRYHGRIFGVFQTLQPRDTVEGSGIGLAMVKKVVEAAGGVVNVTSEVGSGACFSFTWPREWSKAHSAEGTP